MLESLRYDGRQLWVLDQLLLPGATEYIPVTGVQDAWSVIRKMNVRGAPLIAIVACLGLAVEVNATKDSYDTVAPFLASVLGHLEYLRSSRPTAVNLFTATDKLKSLVASMSEDEFATVTAIAAKITDYAETLWREDVTTNRLMGDIGASRILDQADGSPARGTAGRGLRVLTICNTGSLATAGYGTALGVVRSLREMGRLERVYACETRPYNQGSRLTAYEIVSDELPGTLISDSMAAALMARKGIDVVVVGADRVAANGDTANKIGTYQLAIAAKHHGVPFYVASPTTSLDVSLANGSLIPVEERPASELTTIAGQRIAPEGIDVWNPGFDVTPCELITGIITEVGVITASDFTGNDDPQCNSKDGTIDIRIIDVPAFLRSHGKAHLCDNAVDPNFAPVGYKYMNSARIAEMCAQTPKIAAVLGTSAGGSIDASLLHVTEVGDGNLNFVYIVKNTVSDRAVVIKQALPFVRCVGDSWPLSLDRAAFEQQALIEERAMSPEHVPEVYLYDPSTALIAMEYIAPPNAILRKLMMTKTRLPLFASQISQFMARTLFKSSMLALNGPMIREKVGYWSKNIQMCALTEQVIFTDPFIDAKYNNWTKPFLDSFVMHLRSDADVLIAAADLKMKFLGSPQALLHGDLHSGSIMASEGATYVIDPEFAFYGPIGFDVGSLLANLLMSYFSQPGHACVTAEDESYPEWILAQIQSTYELFTAEFLRLWEESHYSSSGVSGYALSGGAFAPKEVFAKAQSNFMRALWWDTLGFMGIEIIRRIVGIAHVADFKEIADESLRADCQKRSLAMARLLMLVSSDAWRQSQDVRGEAAARLSTPAGLVDLARQLQSQPVPASIVLSI